MCNCQRELLKTCNCKPPFDGASNINANEVSVWLRTHICPITKAEEAMLKSISMKKYKLLYTVNLPKGSIIDEDAVYGLTKDGFLRMDNFQELPERWRAEEDIHYWVVDGTDLSIYKLRESFDGIDDNRYKVGNYFQTQEQAKEAAEEIKELLKKFHERNKV